MTNVETSFPVPKLGLGTPLPAKLKLGDHFRSQVQLGKEGNYAVVFSSPPHPGPLPPLRGEREQLMPHAYLREQ
jgi:hypothetical protein